MPNPYLAPFPRFGLNASSQGPGGTGGGGNIVSSSPDIIQGNAGATLTADGTVQSSTSTSGPVAIPLLGTRKAYSHYFTQFIPVNDPVATDYYTTQWLTPWGEKGKWLAVGGWLRDRPIPLKSLFTSGDVMLQIMEYEVNQAITAGLNGFTVDLLSCVTSNYHYQRYMKLMDAAAAVSPTFKIVPMADGSSLYAKNDTDLINALIVMMHKPAIARLTDGRPILTTFFAEKWTTARWQAVVNAVQASVGPIAFWPGFLTYNTTTHAAYRSAFGTTMVGSGVWGGGNPRASSGDSAVASWAHSHGLMWMQPVRYQDNRPYSGTYDEATNTGNLRDNWATTIASNAEAVQYVTWSDHSETSAMQPSSHHGAAVLDLSHYYLTQWQTGVAPSIPTDKIYLSHRLQKVATAPVGWNNPGPPTTADTSHQTQTTLMTLRANSTAARDLVEAVTLLTAPATVRITVGSTNYDTAVPAGVGVATAPLGAGTISARVIRTGQTDLVCTSPWAMTSSPSVQDLQYVMTSAAR